MKKIIGIGNAIVDAVCFVDDNFLKENNLIKGSMSLIDENLSDKLSELKIEQFSSGGSVANSLSAMAQLGCVTTFIGKVGMDEFGRKFTSEISKNNGSFSSKDFSENKTAKSFILVTPDAHRTMCTYLGCASDITSADINPKIFNDAAIFYIEGYLWDKETTIDAIKNAIFHAKENSAKIAFSLSDSFCVARHKQEFINLIKSDLDILFANEAEIKEIADIENIEENNFAQLKEFFNQNKKLIAIVTCSEKGCVIFANNQALVIKTSTAPAIIDTTGAGDCFAAGFLYGYINNFNLEKSGELGNKLALKIIQKLGARFFDNEINEIKNAL